MSRAFKCDRCKDYSDGGCAFGLKTEGRKLPLYDGELELCKSCEHDFERWLTPPPRQAPREQNTAHPSDFQKTRMP